MDGLEFQKTIEDRKNKSMTVFHIVLVRNFKGKRSRVSYLMANWQLALVTFTIGD